MLNWIKKIAEILGIVRLLVGLIEPIKEFIRQVEIPGHGPEKKQAVLELVSEVVDTVDLALPGVTVPKELIMNFTSNVIDILVAFYNLTGVFKTKNA